MTTADQTPAIGTIPDRSDPRPLSLSGVIVATALGVMQTGSAIALAALVFTGPAGGHLSRGVTSVLIGSALVAVLVAWNTSFDVNVAGAKNTITGVLAAITVGVAVDAGTEPGLTVAAYVIITGLVAGIALYATGRARLGHVIRFIPYPVIGGYVGATGWLIVRGGLHLTIDRQIALADVLDLATADQVRLWLPGVGLALAIVAVSGPTRQALVLVGAVVAFWTVILTASSLDEAERSGWLLGPLPDGRGLALLTPDEVQRVEWGVIASNAGGIAAVAFIAIIGLLLNVSGVEYVTGERTDLDRELRTAGASSTLSAALGGSVGYIGVGQTLLARRMGASSKLVAVALVLLSALTIAAGADLIGLVPRFVAGALVISPGLVMLGTWARTTLRRGTTGDRVVAIIIVAAVAFVGVLEGVAIGVIAAAAIFVWRYALVDPVRFAATGATMRSSLDRREHDQAVLRQHGDSISVLTLEGYLFFGSAARIGDVVRDRLEPVNGEDRTSASRTETRHIILDFRNVTGVDSSAEAELIDIARLADARSVQVWLASVRPEIQAALQHERLVDRYVADIDRALEAAENEVVSERQRDLQADSGSAEHGNGDSGSELDEELLAWFERVELGAGQTLIEAGTEHRHLYLVTAGSLSVWAADDDLDRRLRRVLPGAFLGEVAFFSGEPASASVVADSDATVMQIDRERLAELEAAEPMRALQLFRIVLARTSERLSNTNALIADILR